MDQQKQKDIIAYKTGKMNDLVETTEAMLRGLTSIAAGHVQFVYDVNEDAWLASIQNCPKKLKTTLKEVANNYRQLDLQPEDNVEDVFYFSGHKNTDPEIIKNRITLAVVDHMVELLMAINTIGAETPTDEDLYPAKKVIEDPEETSGCGSGACFI